MTNTALGGGVSATGDAAGGSSLFCTTHTTDKPAPRLELDGNGSSGGAKGKIVLGLLGKLCFRAFDGGGSGSRPSNTASTE
jgi:hypothetical protein